ncbi:MAG: stage V sporulation protein SpoVM [Clostridia bacterium]|nr:stage V sporulation protein SpoVM [Clostridia bacterium]
MLKGVNIMKVVVYKLPKFLSGMVKSILKID